MSDNTMNISVTLKDNSPEVLAAIPTAIARALWAIGANAETYAKHNAPVDTGRLRASIVHQESGNSTVIGSNVEYAAAQELGTSRGIRPKHYLQQAVTGHNEEYKGLVKSSFENI